MVQRKMGLAAVDFPGSRSGPRHLQLFDWQTARAVVGAGSVDVFGPSKIQFNLKGLAGLRNLASSVAHFSTQTSRGAQRSIPTDNLCLTANDLRRSCLAVC